MEPGEFEVKKGIEDTIYKNVKTIEQFTNDTRKLVQDLEVQVEALKRLIINAQGDINQLRNQIAHIQQELSRGGTST